MLRHEGNFTDISVFDEQRFCDAETGVEVQVGHRHRVFQNVPETFLSVEQIEVRAPRKRRARETLRYGNLKLDVGIFRRGLRTYRRTENKIVVLVYAEIRLVREVSLHAVLQNTRFARQ